MPENQYQLNDQYVYTEIAVRQFGKMARREYKIHSNGHGIEIWQCEDCHKELNNIETRNNKKRLCPDCKHERRKKRQNESYWNKKKEVETKQSLTKSIKAIESDKKQVGEVHIAQ